MLGILLLLFIPLVLFCIWVNNVYCIYRNNLDLEVMNNVYADFVNKVYYKEIHPEPFKLRSYWGSFNLFSDHYLLTEEERVHIARIWESNFLVNGQCSEELDEVASRLMRKDRNLWEIFEG